MLELKDVHTHYGLSHVLQGVNLRVGAGEVVGLFGRNGVGKTTVMKTIAGWLAPSSGQVVFDGASIAGVPAAKASATVIPKFSECVGSTNNRACWYARTFSCPSRGPRNLTRSSPRSAASAFIRKR